MEHRPPFGSPEAALAFLEETRWRGEPVCPHCAAKNQARRVHTRRMGVWRCSHCRKQFTVRINTLFEETRLNLDLWLRAIRMSCDTPAGITARDLERELGITYKSAWALVQKLRRAERYLPRPKARKTTGKAIPKRVSQRRKLRFYPVSFETVVGIALSTLPAWKHPEALNERLAAMEAAACPKDNPQNSRY